MSNTCTFWLWAREQPADRVQCGKPAMLRDERINFCQGHGDRLLAELETVAFGQKIPLNEMVARLGLN